MDQRAAHCEVAHLTAAYNPRMATLCSLVRRYLIAGLLTLAPTCAYTQANDVVARDALEVVPGASSVAFKKLGPLWQVYYDVKAPYPAEAVLEQLRHQLTQRGWRPLKEDFLNPGLPSSHVTGWQSFGDGTTKPATLVQQWLAQWDDANGDVLVYAFQYRYNRQGSPDLDTVHVFGSYSSRAVADEQRKAAKLLRTQ